MRFVQVSIIFVFALLSTTAFANYLDISVPAFATPNGSMFMGGYYYLNNSSGFGGVNVNISGYVNSSNTTGDGYMQFNVSAPPNVGEYNITFMTNFSSVQKNISFYVTNISYGSVSFLTKKPPFAASDTVLANITLLNVTNGSVANYTPLVEIFKANGPVDSNWTLRNTTSRLIHNGNITYNITVPSTADGTYLIAVDRGIVHEVFIVKSSYMMAVTTHTSQNETRSDYSPGDGFIILVKIRNSNGDPIGYATNVSAITAQPNGTSTTTTLANDTTREGYYTGSYNTSANLTGTYLISISANVGSTNIDGGTAISTARLKTKLQRNQDFFIEWGDAAAFPTGGEVGLNVIVTNLSNNVDFIGNMGVAADKANCLSVNSTVLSFYPNGTQTNVNISVDANGFSMGKAVCRISFTAPSDHTGFYKITYNVTVQTGGQNVTASGVGYAQIERFALKPTAISSFGGGMDFMTMLYPGDNATFDVGAYDMQNNREVSGVNITNIVVNKIIPLEFFSGSTDILEGTANSPTYFNVTERTNGTLIKNPRVTVQIPVNRTGPFQIEITAELNSSAGKYNVSGRTFYMAKYIMGFVASGGMMGGMGESGGGPAGGAGDFKGASSCSGTKQFQGNVMDIASNSAPKDPVQFVNILQARDELTGKDISSCLSMQQNSSDTTSGSGAIQFPVTFNASTCGSLSGFYFMLINVSYKGRADAIPSGFMCQQLSFWVTGTDSMTGMGAWRVSPGTTVNFSVSNIINLQNSTLVIRNGTFSLDRAMNFNPSTGLKAMIMNGTINATLNNGSAVIQLSPSNFSLTEWPSGFFDLTWRVTANDSDLSANKTDTSWGGFQSSPFDAMINQINIGQGLISPWGATPAAGQDVLLYVWASTNVSRAYCRGGNLTCGNGTAGGNNENITTTTGFIAKSGLPWEGKLTSLTVNYANLTADTWNVGGDWGSEMWMVNVTIPSTTKKGQLMLSIDVNNSKGEKANTEVWVNVATYTVQIGSEEGMNMENNYNYVEWNRTGGVDGTGPGAAAIVSKGWNLTNINATNNTLSKSGRVCLRRALNVSRYGQGQPESVNYNNDTEFLIIDNGTAGVYDTILVKNDSSQRNATYILHRGDSIPSTNVYLWDIMDCGFVRWMNANYTPQGQYGSWAGSYAKGTQFLVPYIIKRGSSPLPNVTVSVDSIIKQNDNFGSSAGGGGFGFDRKLAAGEFNASLINTDSKGVAFVPVTIGTSGSFMMFWRINQSQTVEDFASFKTKGPGGGGDVGTQVQIRNFQTWATKLNRIGVNSEHAVAVVNLRKFISADQLQPNNRNVSYFILSQNDTIFNGTFEQTAANVFVRGSPSANYSFLFNWTNGTADNPYMLTRNVTIFDSDTDLTNSQSRDNSNFGLQVGLKSMSVGAIRNYGENTSLAFYEDGDGGWIWIVNSTQNLSTRICAMTFSRPYTGIESATVYVYGETWGMGSQPTSVPFYWFDPINQSGYSFETKNVTVGPKGCAAIDIVPVSGWVAGSNVNIKAIVKDPSNNTESTCVDSVWMPSQCSNGIDDDGDTKIDYNPWASNNDPGCSSWNDDSENTAY